jgi:hypothetical protein
MRTAEGTRPSSSRGFSKSSSEKTFFGKFVMNFTGRMEPSFRLQLTYTRTLARVSLDLNV